MNNVLPVPFINSKKVAKQIFDTAVQSHQRAFDAIEVMEKHFSGAKARTQQDLIDRGEAWRNNWSFGKGKAKVDTIVLGGISSIKGAVSLSTVNFRQPTKDDSKKPHLQFLTDQRLRGIVSDSISRVFAEMVELDRRFESFVTSAEYNTTLWGYVPITREKFDWMGEARHVTEVYFKPGTTATCIKQWAVRETISGMELYSKWKKLNGKKLVAKELDNKLHHFSRSGWTKEGLEEILLKLYSNSLDEESRDLNREVKEWAEVTPAFMEAESYNVSNLDDVELFKIFMVESDGSLTVTYIDDYQIDCDGTGNESLASSEYILFQRNYPNIDIDSVINIIRDTGVGSSPEIAHFRGAGKQIAQDSIMFDRHNNELYDKALFSGSPMLQAPGNNTNARFAIQPKGAFTLVPNDFNFVERQTAFDINPHITIIRHQEAQFNREIEHFDPTIEGKLTSRPTKDEVAEKSKEVNKAKNSRSVVKIKDWERLFNSMFQSLINIKFKEEDDGYDGFAYFMEELRAELLELGLIVDGDDELTSQQVIEIAKSVKRIEIDYLVQDVESITLMLQSVSTQFARNRLERMRAFAMGWSRREINRLFPLNEDTYRNYSDERIAAIENDMFNQTEEIVYEDRDNAKLHLDVHLSKANRVFLDVQQSGRDPVEAFNYLRRLANHSSRHMDKMLSNPLDQRHAPLYVNAFKKLIANIKYLKSYAEKAAKQLAQQQKEGNQNPEIPPIDKAKIDVLWFHALEKEKRTQYLTGVRQKENQEKAEFDRQLKLTEMKAKLDFEKERRDIQIQMETLRAAS